MATPHITYPHQDVTRAIIGGAFDVSNELGHGFSEAVNRSALVLVLRQNGLSVVEEQILRVLFRNQVIGTFYGDLVVEGVVLVEVKAAAAIEAYAEAQLLNYLKAAGGGVGLLLNSVAVSSTDAASLEIPRTACRSCAVTFFRCNGLQM